MKSKSLLLLGVAAGCGLVGMIGIQQWMSAQGGKKVDRVRVLVAKTEIDPGVRLTEELVGYKEVPRDGVPEDAVVKDEQFAERALKTRAFRGQVIQTAQLGEKGQFGTSLEIPVGQRLVTVPVNSTMTHSGIMKPGDRVDIVLTYTVNRRGVGQIAKAKTILEYIQIYAMGDQKLGTEPVADAKGVTKDVKNVSMLVTPLQAEILKFAEKKGTLHLTLRSTLDHEAVASSGTDEERLERLQAELADLEPGAQGEKLEAKAAETPVAARQESKPSFAEFLNAAAPAEAAPPPKPTWKMEIFAGDQRTVHELELPEADDAGVSAKPTAGQATAPVVWGSLQRMFRGGKGQSAAGRAVAP